MKWQILFSKQAEKELKKLSRSDQERILKFLYEKVSLKEDPLELAKQLKGRLSGFFRFRVGDYRILFKIEHEKLVILVLKVAHRREIYDE